MWETAELIIEEMFLKGGLRINSFAGRLPSLWPRHKAKGEVLGQCDDHMTDVVANILEDAFLNFVI